MKYDPYFEDLVYDPNDEFIVDAGLSVSFDFVTLEKYEDYCEKWIDEILDDLEVCVKDLLDDYSGDIETDGFKIEDVVIIRD